MKPFCAVLSTLLFACVVTFASHAIAQTPDDTKPEQQRILKLFRDEFIEITPGENGVPEEYEYDFETEKRTVRFKRPFLVARYEVTQELWRTVTGSNPSHWTGDRNSVEMLSFSDAVAFCNAATKLMRDSGLIDEDQWVRLPTEIEWQFFAAAGSVTIYSFGDDAAELGRYAWFTENAAGNDPPVGAKLANAWGLYDAHGYLWEWCVNCQAEDSPVVLDLKQWQQLDLTTDQVLRSGSWKDSAEKLTTGFRRIEKPDFRDDAVGLRCVLVRTER